MNCFRHPNAVAAAFCKGCSKPLCLDCYEQTFDKEIKHVCSEECARTVRQQPEAEEPPDSLFDKIFADVYITALVVGVGGVIGACYFGFVGSLAIDGIKHPPMLGYSWSPDSYHDPRSSPFRILYDFGLTDSRALFSIGAVLGIACAALYLKFGGKITISICILIYLVLSLWTAWT
jgi:hypothetical protein